MAYEGYNRLRVLVVDDFDNFRMTVSQMLQHFGVQDIDTAMNGSTAVRLCKEKYYDLILCDYNLGRGKNGQQVLEELRFRRMLKSTTLFILVAADSSKSMVMAAYDYEPDAYLTKPITAKALKQRLDRLLAQRDDLKLIFNALDSGETDSAIALCEEKLNQRSRHASRVQRILCQLLLDAGRYEQAQWLLEEVLAARPLEWALLAMARLALAQGDLTTALEKTQAITAENPLCMAAYDIQAEAFARQQQQQQVQKVLHQAVDISPNAILRQQRLATVAMDNGDMEVAAGAFRRAVRLGEHSCHDQVESHVNFGRATAALGRNDPSRARELSREAIKVLDGVAERFGHDIQRDAQVLLVEAQVQHLAGNKQQAQEMLEAAKHRLDELPGAPNLDTQLDLAQAWTTLGERDQAQELLSEMVQTHKGDQAALQRIDRLLDEPVSEHNQEEVSRRNREGIAYFEAKEYAKAIDCFQAACKLFPQHIGLSLNLVQALLEQIKLQGKNDEQVAQALATLRRLEHIRPKHPQFARYRQLYDRAIHL